MRDFGKFVSIVGFAVTASLTTSGLAVAAPDEQTGDHLELVALSTRGLSTTSSSDVIPFRAVVDYRLQSTSNGFLLAFLFENSESSSTRQSSDQVTVQGGSGRASVSIDYA